jgi:hypothetical protein
MGKKVYRGNLKMKINNKQHITKNGKVKKNPINIPYPKIIKKEFQTFKIALITEKNVFYVDEEESDEDGATIMYDRNMNKISDNYFATEEYLEQSKKHYKNKSWVWASNSTEYNVKEHIEEERL